MSTKIIEGNELIAEFDGFVPQKSELGNTFTHPNKMGVYGGVGLKFKYHTSWDWLMPVIRKAWESTYSMDVDDQEYVNHCFRILNMPIWADINSAYAELLSFIQWYNKTKQQ